MVTIMNGPSTELTSNLKDNVETNDTESSVFTCIQENNLDELKDLYSRHKLKADLFDSEGMTPLQHACYKGNQPMVEFFIEKVSIMNFCSSFKSVIREMTAFSGCRR